MRLEKRAPRVGEHRLGQNGIAERRRVFGGQVHHKERGHLASLNLERHGPKPRFDSQLGSWVTRHPAGALLRKREGPGGVLPFLLLGRERSDGGIILAWVDAALQLRGINPENAALEWTDRGKVVGIARQDEPVE